MNKKIGFDIDGVVVDFVTMFQEYLNDHYNISFKQEDLKYKGFESISGLPYSKVLKLVNLMAKDIPGQIAHIYPDNVSAIYKYAERDPNVTFITHRWVKKDTYKFLDIIFSGIKYNVHFVSPIMSKSGIIRKNKIDLFVDDGVNIVKDLHANGIESVLMEQPYNIGMDVPVKIIKSLEEII